MQKLLQLLLLLLIGGYGLNAQQDQRLAAVERPLQEVQSLQLPTINNKALLEAEMARRAPGVAPHFAETMPVNISPDTHGNWDTTNDGMAVWRLRIPSPGAKSLNLGFDQFVMPEGGSLILYTPDLKTVQGPFTPADNEEHEELWTPIIPGDEIVVEVSLPLEQREALRLHLKSINHDFLGFSESALSGSCNVDVICSLADGWGIVDNYRDIIQSVAVISQGGNTFCTGFLVTNTREDCAPFFMTANHCGVGAGNAPSLVAYWNFINSECRELGPSGTSGGPGDGELIDFNTGAIHRASYPSSDFTLVEFDDPISETANAWFAGWDAREILETDTIIAIHHPSTDEKRISFNFNGVYRGDWGAGESPVSDGNHLIIDDWEIGTTEGGSSGSPIFNSDKRVVGQLHGGAASCNNMSYDSYGWFASSWVGGGSSSNRLSDWLDPDGTGIMFMDGRSQIQCSFFVGATPANQSLCAPENAEYTIEVNENFAGPVSISLNGLPDGLTAVFDATTVMPGGTTNLTISGTTNLTTGNYTFTLNGTDGANTSNQTLVLNVVNGLAAAPLLSTPVDMATDQLTQLNLIWEATPEAASYDVEIATDAEFSNIITTATQIMDVDLNTSMLDVATTYYWRVRSVNLCGTSDWSAPFSFETGFVACSMNQAIDLPLSVGPSNGTVTTSVININETGMISSMRLLNLDIDHTYIGDLNATLTSPSGTTIDLFDESGCGEANILVDFDDSADQTAGDFANSCMGGGYAVSGVYQPLQAFSSSFIGEEMQGEWVLRITDNFNQDGGNLNNWSLDFCTLIPNVASITSSVEEMTICVGETTAFDISLGIGFQDDVTLSGMGLPNEAMLNFEANPVETGSTLSASVGNINEAGTYNLELSATDGTQTVMTTVVVNIIDVNEAPALMSPADGAADVDINALLASVETEGANFYNFILSTQADLSDPVLEFPALNANLLANNLDFGTTYYWAVSTENDCGTSMISEIWSFTTVPNTSITHNIANLTSCPADAVELMFIVGAGFGDSPMLSIESSTGEDISAFTQLFDNETGTLTVSWPNFATLTAGVYDLTATVTGNSYSNNTSFPLTIESVPGFTSLQTPMDAFVYTGETVGAFSWSSVAETDTYLLEIASDDAFSTVIFSESSTQTNLDVDLESLMLEEGQYYWRVSTGNECGESVSGFFTFELQPNATYQLGKGTLEIHPNPTNGPLIISFDDENRAATLDIELFTTNGQQLNHWNWSTNSVTKTLDLSYLPAGVYWIKITNGQVYAIEKIVLLD